MATITKRRWVNKSGEHEAWVLAFTDASGKRHKEQFGKKREADARRVEVEGQVRSGAFRADATKFTVADACDKYIAHLTARNGRGERVTTHYLKTTESQLWNYVAPKEGRAVEFAEGIGDIKLAQLTASRVGEFRDALRDAGVGVVTTRRVLGSLSRALTFAASKDLVAINVAAGIKVTGRRDEGSKKVTPPSKALLAAVMKAADENFRTKLKFAAASGLRASELHALRWNRLDLEAATVTVDSRVDVYGNVDTTKSEAGIRSVPLGRHIVDDLKSWRTKSKFGGDEHLVFPDTKGSFVRHGNMLKRQFRPLLAKVAEKASEDGSEFKAFGWHAIRHFAISTWIEAGLAPKTVQTFAGHSSLAVTMSRYGHMFPKDSHRQAMDKIASALFSDGAQMAHDAPEAAENVGFAPDL